MNIAYLFDPIAYLWILACIPLALILQLFMQKIQRRWGDRWAVSAILAFTVSVVASLIYIHATMDDGPPLTRLLFWNAVIGAQAVIFFIAFWIFFLAQLGCWAISNWLLRKFSRAPMAIGFPWKVSAKFISVALLLSGGTTAYLATYKTLGDAVLARDFELIERRLRFNLLGVDTSNGYLFRDSGGTHTQDLLGIAIKKQDSEMIRFLLECGADPFKPNRGNPWGTPSPLHHAAFKADFETVELFLAQESNPDVLNERIEELIQWLGIYDKDNIAATIKTRFSLGGVSNLQEVNQKLEEP